VFGIMIFVFIFLLSFITGLIITYFEKFKKVKKIIYQRDLIDKEII